MGSFRAVGVGMAAMALWTAAAGGFPRQEADGYGPLDRFQSAVDDYMALREVVKRTLPPLEITPDAEDIRAASDAIAEGIRRARSSAKEGDIFNADVAGLLRLRIGASSREPGCDVAEILAAERDDDDVPPPPRPLVHDRLDWGWGSFMPWCVLRVLPLVPDELQFRFVEHDLVLVDIDASLVVDVLPNALPARGSWKGLRYAHARDGNRGRKCRRDDQEDHRMANRQASFGQLDEIRDLKATQKAPAIFAASPRPL